ncbi:hypothetical protein C0J52_22071, partial [Blattella germanica]
SGQAHKECLENGTWYRHPESKQVWSNYTTCVDIGDLNWRVQVNRIYETGYLVSLVALLISLGILFYFKSLRCSRTTLHMNLFASFAMNNALWLLWYRIVVPQPEIIVENGGFYLHTLLVAAFISESRLVKWLYGLGWAMPFVPTVIYTSLRASNADEEDTKESSSLPLPYFKFYRSPYLFKSQVDFLSLQYLKSISTCPSVLVSITAINFKILSIINLNQNTVWLFFNSALKLI